MRTEFVDKLVMVKMTVLNGVRTGVYVLVVASFSCTAWAAFDQKDNKVVGWGFNTPNPVAIKTNIGPMQQVAFDGMTSDLQMDPPGGHDTDTFFAWNAWGATVQNASTYSQSINALNTTQFDRFADRFILFNAMPGNLDLYSDHSALMANATLASKVAHDSGAKGIMLDVEHYMERPDERQQYNYSAEPQSGSHSFAAFQSEVRSQGAEFMPCAGMNDLFLGS